MGIEVCARSKALLLAVALSGCVGYRAEPLATQAHLASSVAALDRTIPATNTAESAEIVPATQALSVDQIGLLAILNDPDLAAEFGQAEQASAALLTERTLPNPQLSFADMALLGAPLGAGAIAPDYTASLSQDITSLITYRPRVAAARAQFGSVNAQLLWQEWQVAQQARLLAVGLYGTDQEIAVLAQELAVLTDELAQVRQAALAGNLDLTDEAPLRAAEATAESALATARLTRLQSWQSLDALLGLQASVRFDILPPQVVAPPADLAPLLASLPARRPDLVALQLGYKAADEQVRAAILAQFPALALGPSYESDTSNIQTLGPQVTIDLPIFNRNQGGVAGAQATREVLHAQYQAALDSTAGTVQALGTNITTLEDDLSRARIAAADAKRALDAANQAYSQNSLDQRALADYQTAALERDLDVINFQSQLNADQLALGVELGLGLPQMRIAPQPNSDPAATHKVSQT